MDISDVRGMTALRTSLKFIDSVPSDAPLPAMPGFDRDWMESMMAGYTEDQPKLSLGEALGMCLEWIDAIPAEVRNSLETFDEESVRAERDRLSSRLKIVRPK